MSHDIHDRQPPARLVTPAMETRAALRLRHHPDLIDALGLHQAAARAAGLLGDHPAAEQLAAIGGPVTHCGCHHCRGNSHHWARRGTCGCHHCQTREDT